MGFQLGWGQSHLSLIELSFIFKAMITPRLIIIVAKTRPALWVNLKLDQFSSRTGLIKKNKFIFTV
jgi:hypothetical protein